MKHKSFPCSGCGACCKRIDKIEEFLESQGVEKGDKLYFPHKHDETGRCEMLQEDNTCKVYEDRPLICNVDKLRYMSGMSKKKFYALNISACNVMIKEDGLDEKYLINVKKQEYENQRFGN